MRFSRENGINSTHRTIVVVAECMLGALEAGRFAARNLLDSNSKLVLLQTYQQPKFGQSMLRDIAPMLQKIAEEELDSLEYLLSNEFQIPPNSISKMVLNKDLSTVFNDELSKIKELSILIGLGPKNSRRRFPCRNVVNSAINSGIRPFFVVSDSITLFEKENVVVYTGEEKELCKDYQNFLDDIKAKHNMQLSIQTMKSRAAIMPSQETTVHFKTINGTEYNSITQGEILLRKELKRVSVE